MPRPLFSRTDLNHLKTLNRGQVLDVLGSFDERADEGHGFILGVGQLLDAGRVPGLSEALQAGDTDAVLTAVEAVCRSAKKQEDSTIDAETLRQAEDVLIHRFKFYTETHSLPREIDWDYNPGTAHWGHDLNRFSYLGLLTRAYFATRDVRFARKAVELILDWITKCDIGLCFVGTPYVFGSYLNNASHCAAWARCVKQLLPEGQVQPLELLRILKSLHDQMAYLEIVTNGHAGNWPTIGCQAILQTLAAFPVFRDTDRFVDYCIDTMARQVEEQILPDGAQDELTPHYHSVVVNNLLSASESLQALGRTLAPGTLETLRKMVHYQQQTIVPDCSAQVAFNDSDPESVPNPDARLERLGLGDFILAPEALGPEAFPYAGVGFLRQKATDGDLYLAFDGGPYGRSHQHEDKLGFWLFAYGRNFIVDPGRHLYDHSAVSFLDHLKSTRAHSTLCIDGQGQNSRNRRDSWIAKAPGSLSFKVGDGEIRASSAYDLGYGSQNDIQVTHRREIVFVRERFWVVFDRVEGEGTHLVTSRFQFYPGDVVVDGTRAVTQYSDANLLLWSSGPWDEAQVSKGQENPRSGWYSPSYSRIEPAPCVCFEAQVPLPLSSATLLFPFRGAFAPEVFFTFEDGRVVVESPELGEVAVVSGVL